MRSLSSLSTLAACLAISSIASTASAQGCAFADDVGFSATVNGQPIAAALQPGQVVQQKITLTMPANACSMTNCQITLIVGDVVLTDFIDLLEPGDSEQWIITATVKPNPEGVFWSMYVLHAGIGPFHMPASHTAWAGIPQRSRDLNMNGVIDVKDYWIGWSLLGSHSALLGDMNLNGVIDLADLNPLAAINRRKTPSIMAASLRSS